MIIRWLFAHPICTWAGPKTTGVRVVSDEPVARNIETRCQHGKEIHTMWRRPHGDGWQILGQPKCAECPQVISLAIVTEKPAGMADYRG